MKYFKIKIFLLSLILILSSILFYQIVFNNNYTRYILFFKNSLTLKIEHEVRTVPKQNIKSFEEAFFDELMLGPVNHNFYSYVNPQLHSYSCIVNEDNFYIHFDKTFLSTINENFEFHEISFLLQKNIFTNCKKINNIFVFIDGIQIWNFSRFPSDLQKSDKNLL